MKLETCIIAMAIFSLSLSCGKSRSRHSEATPQNPQLANNEEVAMDTPPVTKDEVVTPSTVLTVASDNKIPFGQETQNGDWTFADRGREKLKKSIASLKSQILNAQKNPFELTAVSDEIKSLYQNSEKLAKDLSDFLELLVIPSNEDLFRMKLTSHYFLLEKNGLNTINAFKPQLDYFVQFGGKTDQQRGIMQQYYIKRLLLGEFAKTKSLSDNGTKELTDLIMQNQQIKIDIGSTPALKKITAHQVEWSELKENFDILANHHTQEFGRAVQEILGAEGYLLTPGFAISLNTNDKNISFSTCETNGGKSYTRLCPEGTDKAYWKQAIFYQFQQTDGALIRIRAAMNLTTNMITAGDGYGYLDTHIFTDFANDGSTHSVIQVRKETDEIEKTIDIAQNMAYSIAFHKYEFSSKGRLALNRSEFNFYSLNQLDGLTVYETAAELFSTSQNKLLAEISKLDSDSLSKILLLPGRDSEILATKSPQELKTWYLERLANLKNLTIKELSARQIGIKNFSYSENRELSIEPAFYLNFGQHSSQLEKLVKTNEIIKLLIHESGHLFGMNDQTAKLFAEDLLRVMAMSKEKDGLNGSFFRVSGQQKPFLVMKHEMDAIIDKTLSQQHASLVNHLTTMGYKIGVNSATVKRTEESSFCQLIDTFVDCQNTFTYISWTESIKHEFTLVDGGVLEITMILYSKIKMDTIEDGHAMISGLFYLKADRVYGYYPMVIGITNKATGERLNEIVIDNRITEQELLSGFPDAYKPIELQKF